MAVNPPQVAAIYTPVPTYGVGIHLGCSFSQAFGIAVMFRVRRVLSLTVHTPIPLRTCIGFTGSVLTSRRLAIWTVLPGSILAHHFGHSPICSQNKIGCV